MKILHVFPLFSLKHGGGTVDLIYKLARAQAKQGHTVTVYAGDYKLDSEYMNLLKGVEVLPFRSWLNFGFYLMPSMVKHVRSHLSSFDVIHLHLYRSFQNWVVHHFAEKYGIPYVLDAHGSVRRFSRKRRLKRLFDVVYGHKILRDAGRVVAETQTGAEEYRTFGVEEERIVLLSPPFDTDEFAHLPPSGQFRDQFGIQAKHIVMFLGRINWIKGIDFLVESFGELANHRQDVVLVIVGPDDGYKAKLVSLIERLGLQEKVLFTGFVSHEEKRAALVDADVVVQTSIYEQGTGVPFEAILCNTCVIVTEHTGSAENIRKIDGGYFVKYGENQQLANTIRKVLDNPAEAESKTKRAQSYIKANLSTAKKIVEYEDLYKDCVRKD